MKQLTKSKTIRFTETQMNSLIILENYGVNVNQFIRLDSNEVNNITVYFQTKDESETFLSKFPKSYNGRLGKGIEYHVSFNFNTFWTNDNTGDKNESAQKRRDKVITKIKSLI